MTDDPGQLLLVGIPGPVLDAETAALLRRVQPGGFILFGRNIQSPEQLRRLALQQQRFPQRQQLQRQRCQQQYFPELVPQFRQQ